MSKLLSESKFSTSSIILLLPHPITDKWSFKTLWKLDCAEIVELWCSCTSVLVLLRVFSNSSKIPAISGQQINHIWREISFSIKRFVEMFRLLQCYLAQGLLTVIYLNQIYAVWALHIFEGCLPDNSSFKFPGNKILLYWLYVSR